MSQPMGDGPLYRRWWKVWPSGPCLPCNSALRPCRASVSQNKTRFREDGFDLDLTYITERIIVHGFPATGVEHVYRNPRMEVQRLLDKYHEHRYKVYNFTNEPGRNYPSHMFQGRIERYPFTDHTCPPLESVVDFCESAKAWLDENEMNVVALHCKAGKGRAGIMSTCLMVRLGDTADEAINKYDSTRVSDMKGLTVVNQRKWPFLYERLIKEVWMLHGGIGMVPGQDPDLRAPKPRATCLWEVSVQFRLQTTTGKRNDRLLPKLSCTLYQQEPMGKKLVHSAKMSRAVPADDEQGIVYALSLPRSAEVAGTFEVLFSAAAGPGAPKRDVMDLWWNTTFLAPEGGDQAFEVSDMDVFSMRLKIRLEQASARVVLRHASPHYRSPARHTPLNRRGAHDTGGSAAAPAPDDDGENGQQPGAQAPQRERGSANGEPRTGSGSVPDSEHSKQKDGAAPFRHSHGDMALGGGGGEPNGDHTGPGDTESDACAPPVAASASPPLRSPLLSAELRRYNKEGSSSAIGPSPASAFSLRGPSPASAFSLRGSSPSSAFPGPSPAGAMSPAWTLEGRTPSSKIDPSAQAAAGYRWARARMWGSNSGSNHEMSISESGAWTPPDNASRKGDARAPPPRPAGASRGAEGLRSKRRAAALRKRTVSGSGLIGSTNASLAAGTTSGHNASVLVSGASTVGHTGTGRGTGVMGMAVSGTAKATWKASSIQKDGGVGCASSCYPFPRQFETDSESEDQVAVGASGFGKRRWRRGGGGTDCDGEEREALLGDGRLAKDVHGPPTWSSSTKAEQWATEKEMAMEMEMAFAQEKRRWEEHRQCLEAELDWALAARARAEARGEEDSARVDALETRLSAWRNEYTVIERDVKQAVGLLEMSLSGLMSAEMALRRWKDDIPQQAYADILSCLTKGDAGHQHQHSGPGRE